MVDRVLDASSHPRKSRMLELMDEIEAHDFQCTVGPLSRVQQWNALKQLMGEVFEGAAKYELVTREIQAEYLAARGAHPPLHSLHEGLAVLQEEVYELMLEVYTNPRKHPERNARARQEAIQVAAMALRLLVDVL